MREAAGGEKCMRARNPPHTHEASALCPCHGAADWGVDGAARPCATHRSPPAHWPPPLPPCMPQAPLAHHAPFTTCCVWNPQHTHSLNPHANRPAPASALLHAPTGSPTPPPVPATCMARIRSTLLERAPCPALPHERSPNQTHAHLPLLCSVLAAPVLHPHVPRGVSRAEAAAGAG